MNNPIPFFNPFINNPEGIINNNKIINRITRLEKEIRILENRLNKLENIEKPITKQDEPTDMYMI